MLQRLVVGAGPAGDGAMRMVGAMASAVRGGVLVADLAGNDNTWKRLRIRPCMDDPAGAGRQLQR